MNRFIANHADDIIGFLSGLNRLVLPGTHPISEPGVGPTLHAAN